MIFFCEFGVLTPSIFGTPVRSHYSIFSSQIMQEIWFTGTYCSVKRQKYLFDKSCILILDFLCVSRYPLLLWTVVVSLLALKNSDQNEPRHEISNNEVCATSKASDQPAHTRSLTRAFDSRLNIIGVLSY